MTASVRVLATIALIGAGLIGTWLVPPLASAETIGSGFKAPQHIATDAAGNVFVADQGNNVVREILADGNYSTTRIFGNGIALPQRIAVDSQGDIFVLDARNRTINEILATGGTVTIRPGTTDFVNPTGLALDGSGNLFVLADGAVQEFLAAAGYTNFSTIYSGPVDNQQGGIALDRLGNVYVAGSGQVVELLAAAGYQATETLGSGFGQISGIAVDGSGNVFVADTPNNAVKEIPAAGGPTVATVGGGFKSPAGVATDAAGNVFVADQGNGAVKEILAAGGYATVETLAGDFDQPAALAVDPGGSLFVADIDADVIKQLTAADNYATADIVSYGFSAPVGIAVDIQGNIFVTSGNTVEEVAATGDYRTVTPLGSGFSAPGGIAVDRSGNVYVADTGNWAVKEILAAGGYTNVTSLAELIAPNGVAIGASGNLFVAVGSPKIPMHPLPQEIVEILAIDGNITADSPSVLLSYDFTLPTDVAVDAGDNIYVTDSGAGTVSVLLAASGYSNADSLIAGNLAGPSGVAIAGNGTIFVSDTAHNTVEKIIPPPPTPLLAATLPSSRSVEIGTPATIFASVINSGAADLQNCHVALPQSAPSGLTLGYQTTDPATNGLTGKPNTPVAIAGNDGAQSFLVSFIGTEAFNVQAMGLDFACDGVTPASIIDEVNTVDLSMSTSPVPDIIALAATPSNNGIIEVPIDSTAAFAVATSNLGAAGTITATVIGGGHYPPTSVAICQSDPTSGTCLGQSAGAVTLDIASGATPTFSIFVQANQAIPLAPASSRIFVSFSDSAGNLHGSTSVAVETVN